MLHTVMILLFHFFLFFSFLYREAVLAVQGHHSPARVSERHLHVREWNAGPEHRDRRLVGRRSQDVLLQRGQVCLGSSVVLDYLD